jgi:hypothetical protein
VRRRAKTTALAGDGNPYAADLVPDLVLDVGPATGLAAVRLALDVAKSHPRVSAAFDAAAATPEDREAVVGSVASLVRRSALAAAPV